ncbi:tyrosine-protein phosphatase [Streptomyces sp. NPDC040724]|uniref:tyrosine-protein phosphatase n=1 Tax=Streptomyces sp. NPDC040724 TaxID=3155612 RepID=UPI0033D943E2
MSTGPRGVPARVSAPIPVPPDNHRDLAGARCDGGVIRPGVILRGALHDTMTPPGLAGTRGRVHLLDLRRADEGTGTPPHSVCRHSWPLHDPQWVRGVPRTPRFFVESGLRLVPLMAAAVADAVRILADGGCVYVGCRLGKDRTGLMVLLLGRIFGVDDAALVEDYVRTGEEYLSATAWVEHYARRRGEAVADVTTRLVPPPGVPSVILAELPTQQQELCELLDLDVRAVTAALRAISHTRPTQEGTPL